MSPAAVEHAADLVRQWRRSHPGCATACGGDGSGRTGRCPVCITWPSGACRSRIASRRRRGRDAPRRRCRRRGTRCRASCRGPARRGPRRTPRSTMQLVIAGGGEEAPVAREARLTMPIVRGRPVSTNCPGPAVVDERRPVAVVVEADQSRVADGEAAWGSRTRRFPATAPACSVARSSRWSFFCASLKKT